MVERRYPTVVWRPSERYDNNEREVIFGMVPGGCRFEFSICEWDGMRYIFIGGSFHCDQRAEVISLARELGLSVFDIQTGERLYLQDT